MSVSRETMGDVNASPETVALLVEQLAAERRRVAKLQDALREIRYEAEAFGSFHKIRGMAKEALGDS